MSGDPEMRVAFDIVPGTTDLFMPSGSELFLLDDGRHEGEAVAALRAGGVRTVVVKRGALGATAFQPRLRIDASRIPVEEVDPTCASDAFGGIFLSL